MTDDPFWLRSLPTNDEILTTNLSFHSRSDIEAKIHSKSSRSSKFHMCIALSAVQWSHPSKASLYHLQSIRIENKLDFQKGGVHCYLIDQEEDRTFSSMNQLMIGVPFLQIWFSSEPIYFQRKGYKLSSILHGPFNQLNLTKIIKLLRKSAVIAQKTATQIKPLNVSFMDEESRVKIRNN